MSHIVMCDVRMWCPFNLYYYYYFFFCFCFVSFFFFQAEDGIRDIGVTGVQTCALPISGVWYIPTYGACVTQAFLTVFAINSSTLWTAAMAIYLYIITSRRQIQLAQKMMFWFHLICWFVPLIMACLALIFGKLGRSGFIGAAGWCWIQTYNNYGKTLSYSQQVLWMILTNFMWKVIAFGIIITLYTLLRLKLKEAVSYRPCMYLRYLCYIKHSNVTCLIWSLRSFLLTFSFLT